jgi:hypothetical protein
MFALISPIEESWSAGSITTPPVLLGQRIAEVSNTEFPVAPPLFWMPCSDDVRAETHYYDPNDQQIKPKP